MSKDKVTVCEFKDCRNVASCKCDVCDEMYCKSHHYHYATFLPRILRMMICDSCNGLADIDSSVNTVNTDAKVN